MRKAFTMVEIIFVIVIIGILAAVAIPKLAMNADDAIASSCVKEIGQLVHEIGGSYTKNGYDGFKNLTISEISNLRTNVGLSKIGIYEDATTKVDVSGVTYYCKGEAVVKLVGEQNGSTYNLMVEDKNPSSMSALKAIVKLRNTLGIKDGESRVYKLL